MDVSVDGSAWRRAAIVSDSGRYGCSVLAATVTLSPGAHVLRSRATEDAGHTQPDVPVWNPSGYLRDAIDVVTFTAFA